MQITPETKALLDMMYRVNAPRFHELDVPQARRSFAKLQAVLGFPSEAVASVLEVPVPRPDGSVLLARLYRPVRSHVGDVLPLVVYFHGGGWTVGDVESYDGVCRRLCNESGHAVLSVDYRLAPENPFPAAVDDAILVIDWLLSAAPASGLSFGRISLAGDSAGGNLAIVAAIHFRECAPMAVEGVAAVYPCVVINSERPSRGRFADGYVLDRGSLAWFFSRYLPDGGADDWRASPLNAARLSNLPRMLLVTAGLDPLTDDCVALRDRVLAEDGECAHLHVEGVPHGFFTLGRHFPEANHVVETIASFLRAR